MNQIRLNNNVKQMLHKNKKNNIIYNYNIKIKNCIS